MFRKYFDLSIKEKIITPILSLIIALAIFTFFYFPYQQEKQVKLSLKDKLQTTAEALALSVGIGIGNGDLNAVKKTFEWTKKDKNIVYISILDESGENLFTYNPNLFEIELKDVSQVKDKAYHKNNTIFVSSKTEYNNGNYGNVIIGYSLNNLDSDISHLEITALLISLLFLVLGLISALIVSRTIANPILRLENAAQRIANGESNIEIKVNSNDEVGNLAKSFITMVDKLHITNEELEVINRELEERVFERTKQLSYSEERFRGLYENSTIGLYRTSANNEILFANPTFVQMLGYNSLEELKGVSIVEKIYKDIEDHKRFNESLKIDGKIIGFEQYWEKNNGEIIFIRESAKATKDENGEILYYDGTVENITVKKEYEEKLITAKESAETAVRMKSEFLAQMSHEIRTPINSILSYTQLLKSEIIDSVPDELKFCFDMIDNGGRRLIRTVDMILNMSELQTGTYEVLPEEINLVNAILKPLVDEFKIAAESKNLSITLINSLRKVQETITIDIYSVTQIFTNLIDNAIKYSFEGGIHVIAYQNSKGLVCVDVQDTGIGISEKFQETLFEPFTQEEQGYTRKFEGNGLGMALVKEYCYLNDIDITLESRKDKGSIFTIIIRKL